MKGKLLILGLAFMTSATSFSQSPDPYNDMTQNRPLVRNITSEGLAILMENNPVEYEKTKYLYTRSFDVAISGCKGCEVDYRELFNDYLFDVTEFDVNRLADDKYTFEYKEHYVVSLQSKKELEAAYSEIEATHIEASIQGLPEIVINHGDIDSAFAIYSQELIQFMNEDLELYEQIYSSKYVIKISLDEFKSLPQERRDSVLNNEWGYLIIDGNVSGALILNN